MPPPNDQDVERAMAALDAPPMAYRRFTADVPQPTGSAVAAPATEFPLLNAALPEAAAIPIPPAELEPAPPPAPAVAQADEPAELLMPMPMPMPMPMAEAVIDRPTTPPPPPAPPPLAAFSPAAIARAAPESAARPGWPRAVDRTGQATTRTGSTSLATMFRSLRSAQERPHEERAGLQDVFRRL